MSLNEKGIASEMIYELEDVQDSKGLKVNLNTNDFDISSPIDVFKAVIRTFPVDSEIYKDFRKIFEDCYLKKLYPTEHVVVLPKWSPYPDFYQNKMLNGYLVSNFKEENYPILKIIPRWQAEYNPYYVQLIVASLIRYGDSFVLLKSSKESALPDDMITMVQGHASYRYDAEVNFMFGSESIKNVDFQSGLFRNYLFDEIQREAKEEIGCDITAQTKAGSFQHIYIPPECKDISDISYYHMGVVFFSKVVNGIPSEKEPSKNKLHIIKGNCGLRLLLNESNIDPWLVKAINAFIPPTKEEK